jgi:hypothetical protein
MYLSELASQGYFDQPEFLNYLKYLEYWRKDGYVQYITWVSFPASPKRHRVGARVGGWNDNPVAGREGRGWKVDEEGVEHSRDKDELNEIEWEEGDGGLGRKRRGEEEEANDSYPTCLAYLTLLQSPLFRERLRDPIFAKDIERIGVRHHETWYVHLFSFSFLLPPSFFLQPFNPILDSPPYPSWILIHPSDDMSI